MVGSLLISLSLGLLLASPQLLATLRYYPTTIRAHTTYEDKVRFGNLSFTHLFHNLCSTRSTQMVDGLHYPEGVCYVGLIPLGLIWLSQEGFWWIVLIISIGLAMGKRGVLFYRTHWLHLRHPVRYCYFISLSLAMLSLTAFTHLSAAVNGTFVTMLVLLQAYDLLLNTSCVIPMAPYVQRWERPSRVFASPLVQFLSSHEGTPRQEHNTRTSGLPYPLRTGQLNRIRTLGYNGGAQPRWMARFREDSNPDGSGTSDWFELKEDGALLDWYGVKYAYTYRPLGGKWRVTAIPHLYENTHCNPHPPTWKEVAIRYGTGKSGESL